MDNAVLTLINSAPIGFFVADTQGTVLYANNELSRETGFSVTEIIGKKAGSLWGRQMSVSFYERLWGTVKNARKPFVAEVTNRHKNGTLYSRKIHVAPLTDERQELAYFIGINPAALSSDESRKFTECFNSGASQGGAATPLIAQLLTIPVPQSASSLPLTSLVELMLVRPTLERYKNRQADNRLIFLAQFEKENFTVLFQKYQRMIKKYFLQRLSDVEVAEDLTQETFIRAYNNLPRFQRMNASYQTFLIRIAHNLLVDFYRARHAAIALEAIEVASNPHASAMNADELGRGFAKLSTDDRHILLLFYEAGYSSRVVAEKMGLSENAIKLRLSRARKKLRLFLTE